eukprot:6230240-Prymnesium_polylepis.2
MARARWAWCAVPRARDRSRGRSCACGARCAAARRVALCAPTVAARPRALPATQLRQGARRAVALGRPARPQRSRRAGRRRGASGRDVSRGAAVPAAGGECRVRHVRGCRRTGGSGARSANVDVAPENRSVVVVLVARIMDMVDFGWASPGIGYVALLGVHCTPGPVFCSSVVVVWPQLGALGVRFAAFFYGTRLGLLCNGGRT